MASTLPGFEDAVRSDAFKIAAGRLVLKDELRGRKYRPTDHEVMSLAASIHATGQLQPCIVRRVGTKPHYQLELVAGYTRAAAVRLINEGFDWKDDEGKTVRIHDPAYMLSVVLRAGNDREALVTNITENLERRQTNPIDDALNQRRLRDSYGMTAKQIAHLYRTTTKVVEEREQLLQLDDETQEKIARGKLSLTAALNLLEIKPEKREAAIVAATQDDGRVNSGTIRAALRETIWTGQAEGAAGSDGASAGGSTTTTPTKANGASSGAAERAKRTMGDLRKFFKGEVEAVDNGPTRKKFFEDCLKFCDGKLTEKTFSKKVDEALKNDLADEAAVPAPRSRSKKAEEAATAAV